MTHDPEEVLQNARRQLEAAGSPSPARDAKALLKAVRGASLADPLTEQQRSDFQHLVERRAAHEPVSHLVGKRAFWMHDFIVTADVLDPRPETETLVEAALKHPFETVLDLGTGSGCILLSLLHECPTASGVGADLSAKALDVAKRNADIVGVSDRVKWRISDWFSGIEGRFDLIVSNPPYIAQDEMWDLAPDLGYEPRIALTDEADGLTAYRSILAAAAEHLKDNGRLMVEIGYLQAEPVQALFSQNGFTEITVHLDLDARNRVVSGVFLPKNDAN